MSENKSDILACCCTLLLGALTFSLGYTVGHQDCPPTPVVDPDRPSDEEISAAMMEAAAYINQLQQENIQLQRKLREVNIEA